MIRGKPSLWGTDLQQRRLLHVLVSESLSLCRSLNEQGRRACGFIVVEPLVYIIADDHMFRKLDIAIHVKQQCHLLP